MKRVALFAALFASAALLGFGAVAGCSTAHSDVSGPTITDIHPGTHGRVIQEPDGFRNVSFSCNGTTGIYESSTAGDHLGSSVAVLANDPACS